MMNSDSWRSVRYQIGDKVEVQGEATSLSFETQPWLKYSWYLASIIKLELDEFEAYQFLVHFDGFGNDRDTWVFEYNLRYPLDLQLISSEEKLLPGTRIEVVGQIDDQQGVKPQSYWEAEVLEDRGESLVIRYLNINWNAALQDRLEVNRNEIRRAEPYSFIPRRESNLEHHRQKFTHRLSDFMTQRGTPMPFNAPSIGSKVVDLYDLYVQVTNYGGIQKVLGVPGLLNKIFERNSCYVANSQGVTLLKNIYMELLYPFEQQFFLTREDRRDERMKNSLKRSSSGSVLYHSPKNNEVISSKQKRNVREDDDSDVDYKPREDPLDPNSGLPKRKAIQDNDRSCKVCGDYGVVHATHSESMDKYFRDFENYSGEALSDADSLCRRCYQHWYQHKKRMKEKTTKTTKPSPVKEVLSTQPNVNPIQLILSKCKTLLLDYKKYNDLWTVTETRLIGPNDHALDLNACLSKLDASKYRTPKEFAEDVRNVFSYRINKSDHNSALHLTANSLLHTFNRQFEALMASEGGSHHLEVDEYSPTAFAPVGSPQDEPHKKKMKNNENINIRETYSADH